MSRAGLRRKRTTRFRKCPSFKIFGSARVSFEFFVTMASNKKTSSSNNNTNNTDDKKRPRAPGQKTMKVMPDEWPKGVWFTWQQVTDETGLDQTVAKRAFTNSILLARAGEDDFRCDDHHVQEQARLRRIHARLIKKLTTKKRTTRMSLTNIVNMLVSMFNSLIVTMERLNCKDTELPDQDTRFYDYMKNLIKAICSTTGNENRRSQAMQDAYRNIADMLGAMSPEKLSSVLVKLDKKRALRTTGHANKTVKDEEDPDKDNNDLNNVEKHVNNEEHHNDADHESDDDDQSSSNKNDDGKEVAPEEKACQDTVPKIPKKKARPVAEGANDNNLKAPVAKKSKVTSRSNNDKPTMMVKKKAKPKSADDEETPSLKKKVRSKVAPRP
jgi:hypothetical protein